MSIYPRTFWLIERPCSSGTEGTKATEALRSTLATGEKALVVFSFEAEAGMFLREAVIDDADGEWSLREVGAGELVSMMYCLYAGIERVVLDPLPLKLSAPGDSGAHQSLDREAFVYLALERGRSFRSTPECGLPHTDQTNGPSLLGHRERKIPNREPARAVGSGPVHPRQIARLEIGEECNAKQVVW